VISLEDASLPSIGYLGHLVTAVAARAQDTRDPRFLPLGRCDLVIERDSESLLKSLHCCAIKVHHTAKIIQSLNRSSA